MRYTLWARGEFIGETDLGFRQLGVVGENSRAGSFFPAEHVLPRLSEMAIVASAMRAYLMRNTVDFAGGPVVQPHLKYSEIFGDLAEYFHGVARFELELRDERGAVVPTELIGLQDRQEFLRDIEAMLEAGTHECDEFGFDDAFGDDTELDGLLSNDIVDDSSEWSEESIAPAPGWFSNDVTSMTFPRYQIHVVLRG